MTRHRTLSTLRLGLKSIRVNPLLSSLTVMGIFLVLASVILMLAIGEAARFQAIQQITDLVASNIIVRSVKPADDDPRDRIAQHALVEAQIALARGDGAGALKSLALGDQLTQYELYYMSPTLTFEANKQLARTAGSSAHAFNMQRYLDEINAETTLAPDDQTALRRLQFLHYIMQYPNPAIRGIPGLPRPTRPQITQYNSLMRRKEPVLFLLNQLAVSMGLPNNL